MRNTSLILTVMLCAAMGLQAQNLPFRNYTIANGLSESVVNALEQDNEGYLWIGTSYGLNRFDGRHFQNYYTEQGLENNEIYALYEDREGHIWIGTGSGVNVFASDSIYSISELEPLQNSTIHSIYQDHSNGFWFATDGQGVWHLDGNRNIRQYRQVNGLGGDQVRDIIEDEQGVLWFATSGGLTKLDDGNFRTYTVENGLPDNQLRDLLVTTNETLWIGTRSGICRMENDHFQCYTENEGLINDRILSLSEGKPGELWIGTEFGVSHFKDGHFINYSNQDGLPDNIIQSTLYDREGNIWFGTIGGGLSLFLGPYLKSYDTDDGLPNNVVTGISQDGSGDYWIATYGGGLAKLSSGHFSSFNTSDGLASDKVYGIKASKSNQLNSEFYVGTRSGLSIYNGQRFLGFEGYLLSQSKILSLYQGSESWWMGTYGDGTFKYNGHIKQRITKEDGLASNIVIDIEQAQNGALWFATYGGVSRLKNGELTNFTIQDGLPNNGVLDMLKDQSGHIWFATFGGLAHYKDGRMETFTAKEGLPAEVCHFIEQDDQGIYWIGTNKGVVRFDYQAFGEVNGEQGRAFKLITEEQGLAGNDMNTGASFKDRNGNLWFGSMDGLTMLDPTVDMSNSTAPKVHIDHIKVSGDEFSAHQPIEIASNNRNITISFIGINFTNPSQVAYKYRLKNSGEGWQSTSQGEVRYTALSPGEYTFEVKAQNGDGYWSKQNASLGFEVLAPFWLRWWFIALILLVLLGIIFLIYNYYRVRKMIDIERMRVRIASDLHDDVGSALTEIALQSDFLQTMDAADAMEEPLQQIGTKSRKIVSGLDDIVWSIDARNDTVGDLTDRMQDYSNNVLSDMKIRYDFEGKMHEKLKVSYKENLYLIFKEAVNNIAKHSDADEVKIALSSDGSRFLMSIKDNGTVTREGKRTGHGLRNMKMRAKRIDADIVFNTTDGFEIRVTNKGKQVLFNIS